MNAKIDSLEANNTWEMVDLPHDKLLIDYKIVYKIKYKVNGEIETCKVRIMAKGLTQQEEVDFLDTYSLVVMMITILVLLTLST